MSGSTIWICPSCGCKIEWDMENVADKGTPVCPKCDIDCKLQSEICNTRVSTNITDEVEELSSDRLMQNFISEEKLHFEGESAIKSLNKITEQLGYEKQSYQDGTSLEEFLKDNSGCCQAIIEWIIKWMDKNSEWKENFSHIEDQ